MVNGARAVERCDILGLSPYSDMAGGLFRGYLTPAYVASQRKVAAWMAEAGMRTRIDAAGNLIGRYEGASDGPALIIGSHLDSVRDGGRYDGPLGIMLGIECVAALHGAGRRLRFPIEIYAFGDEEGSRFPLAMLTSRAVAGVLPADVPDMVDADGISLYQALADYGAAIEAPAMTSVKAFANARHRSALAYFEAHIEQGPVLEAMGLPLGNVTGIAAQKRFAITVAGRAGHAGTTTMALRSDALTAAAEMVLAAERAARNGGESCVATVGMMTVAPGAANVIPGEVRLTLDVRAGDNAVCATLASEILADFGSIASARDVTLHIDSLHDLAASPCDADLMQMMDEALVAEGLPPHRLMSGAGHDAMIMSALCPTAMLFIRCQGGVSHNPAESVSAEDSEIAGRVMLRFIERLEDRAHA